MRLAWFRPGPATDGFDDLAAVVTELRSVHTVDVIDRARAHDFVWRWARGEFDLCVYELANTPAHQYIWPYLLHYPGVLALRAASLHDSRATALIWEHRDGDYAAELEFSEGIRHVAPWHAGRGTWPMWRVPVLASRATVVADEALRAAVASACPDARVAWISPGVPDPGAATGATEAAVVRFGVDDPAARAVAERAAARARAAGAALTIVSGGDSVATAREADVILATDWPALGRSLTSALLGAAAGKAVVVAETESTAGWPALDPQTWQPRTALPESGARPEPPIVVSIDPRDEEHSLVLAMKRLAGDAALRRALGAAARDWWARTATVSRAVDGWRALLDDARLRSPVALPAGWPRHLSADAGDRARAILAEFGLAPEF